MRPGGPPEFGLWDQGAPLNLGYEKKQLCDFFDFQSAITLSHYKIYKIASHCGGAQVSYLMLNKWERPIIENETRGAPQIFDIWAIKKSNFVKFLVFKGP